MQQLPGGGQFPHEIPLAAPIPGGGGQFQNVSAIAGPHGMTAANDMQGNPFAHKICANQATLVPVGQPLQMQDGKAMSYATPAVCLPKIPDNVTPEMR
eukprot:11026962-Karenia_brevis.AAC.1